MMADGGEADRTSQSQCRTDDRGGVCRRNGKHNGWLLFTTWTTTVSSKSELGTRPRERFTLTAIEKSCMYLSEGIMIDTNSGSC